MKNKFHITLISFLILIFRFTDLYTTHSHIVDFKKEEQNLLVHFFNLNIYEFFILETLLALLLVFIFIYATKKSKAFKIKADNFNNYVQLFFFNKTDISFLDWLLKIPFSRLILLFGSIIPVFIITTSSLFILNNIWVNLFISKNQLAIKYYLLFNNIYFFDILIFIFPPIFLLFLLYKKLLTKYFINNYLFKGN
ncbi:hypothetical protein D3C86_1099710 [compost metagenome]